MSTIRVEDILRKKQVPSRYQPSSYRIFSDEIVGVGVPDNSKFANSAPPIYTQPMIVPAQAIEDRNRPHGDRAAGFIRENAHTLNEPVGKVISRNVKPSDEKRWWEWTLPAENPHSLKKRSQSTSNPQREPLPRPIKPNSGNMSDMPGFQTTYQQEHGYLKSFAQQQPSGARIGNVNENQGAAMRHTYNPNTSHAVGIVPVNDLTSHTKANDEQRVFADKMSFEHHYDSRKDGNYPVRGKRQGAYVIEQIEPKQAVGTRNFVDRNKGASVWDAMHIDQKPPAPIAPLPPRSNGHTQAQQQSPVSSFPPPATSLPPHASMSGPAPVLPSIPTNGSGSHQVPIQQQQQQRRDPIGYYEDPKFGAPMQHQQYHSQQQPSQFLPPHVPQQQHDGGPSMSVDASGKSDISYQTKALAYNPSWSNINADFQQQRQQAQKNQMMNGGSANFPLELNHNRTHANELLDNAMMFQRPLINGH